jgi:hypothetical protein
MHEMLTHHMCAGKSARAVVSEATRDRVTAAEGDEDDAVASDVFAAAMPLRLWSPLSERRHRESKDGSDERDRRGRVRARARTARAMRGMLGTT